MNPAWDVGFLAMTICSLTAAAADRNVLWTFIGLGCVAMWLLYVAGDLGLVHGL